MTSSNLTNLGCEQFQTIPMRLGCSNKNSESNIVRFFERQDSSLHNVSRAAISKLEGSEEKKKKIIIHERVTAS